MTPHDRTLLRDLARRVAEIGALPVMERRRAEWRRHNRLLAGRPMILIFPEGAWAELLPERDLACREPEARRIEFELRHRIHAFEHFRADNVVEGEWTVHRAIHSTGWGLEPRHHDSPSPRGAWAFDPVIREPADLRKLRFPEVRHDEAETERRREAAEALFGDILRVRVKGVAHVSFHLMGLYTGLRGLEQTMTDMCGNPGWLHEAMELLTEGHLRLVRQYEEQNLLSLNNDNTYHSSGGNGFTDELPAPGFDPGRVRPRDMWASAESQELAQVSPRMHAEFATCYEKRLLARFGLNGYGCCENLTSKLEDVLTIPHLRRVSVAPTASVPECAARIGRRCILSWKPDPTFVIGRFDAGRLRAYLREAIEAAEGCALEMILKDTHTCEHRPERFDAWSSIAEDLVAA